MSNEPNLELMREIGLIPSGVVPKYPVELFVDYPDLIAGVHEYAEKIVAEYKQKLEAAEAKLRELEMQEPVGYFYFNDQNNSWRQIDADWAKKEPCSSIPLYAKPFPAPKQEEK